MPRNVRLDHAGIREVLQSEAVFQALHGLADEVAAEVRSHPRVQAHGVDGAVEVEAETTDRARLTVGILHPAGKGLEAKHGVLTRAAGAAGLDVNAGSRSGS